MILLFLDFDGCVHSNEVFMRPCSPADALNLSAEELHFFVTKYNLLVTGENLFEHCDRLAVTLEPFPEVKIVISSTWKQYFEIDALKCFLPPALAERVVGVTPQLFSRGGTGQRMREIGLCLEQYGYPQWIALDDSEYPFLIGDGRCRENLLLLDSKEGFTDAASVELSKRLREMRKE
jgi:hypothetical protein